MPITLHVLLSKDKKFVCSKFLMNHLLYFYFYILFFQDKKYPILSRALLKMGELKKSGASLLHTLELFLVSQAIINLLEVLNLYHKLHLSNLENSLNHVLICKHKDLMNELWNHTNKLIYDLSAQYLKIDLYPKGVTGYYSNKLTKEEIDLAD